jgi:hypothetical protein
MIQTILTIILSTGLGIGSTLLVQTVILTPAPVVLACPEPIPETDKSPSAFPPAPAPGGCDGAPCV